MIEGISKNAHKNRLAIRTAFATAFGVSTQEIVISDISPKGSPSTTNITVDVSYYVEIKSLKLENAVNRMKTTQKSMADAVTSTEVKNNLASSIASATSQNVLVWCYRQ